jgi:hypothetical protein
MLQQHPDPGGIARQKMSDGFQNGKFSLREKHSSIHVVEMLVGAANPHVYPQVTQITPGLTMHQN